MSRHQGLPIPPIAMGAAAAAQRFAPKGRKAKRARRAAALVVMAASGATLLTTLAAFLKHGTTVDPTSPASTTALVTTGSNAISRNPMYAAMAGVLVAHALDRGSWRALLPVAGFVVAVDRLQIVWEERALRELFGDEYLDYCRSTPRWVDARSLQACMGRRSRV